MCHRFNLRRPRAFDGNVDEEQIILEHLEGYDAPAEGFWEGYCDAQAGRPFDPDAYPDSVSAQLHFECGYELGSSLLARGIRIRWPDRRFVPDKLIAAAPEAWE
jgi:hypothetical protein